MNWIKLNKTYIILSLCTMALMPSCSVQQRLKRADKKYAIGEYYSAAEAYKKILPHIKDKALKGQTAFKQGECYRYINHPKASSAYAVAIRQKYQQQDSIVLLRQAQVLQYAGKYGEAEKYYKTYLENHTDCYEAQAGVYACTNISEWKKQPTRYKISIEKDFAAKRASTFAPQFIGEEADAIMFTSNRTARKKKDKKNSPVTGVPVNQLYTTRKDAQGKWVEIELTEGLYEVANGDAGTTDSNSQSDDREQDGGGETNDKKQVGTAEIGVCCFTNDGRTMYFTYSKPINGKDLGAKIYTSSRASGTWGEPQELKLFKDSTITAGHPTLNHAGDTLWFASDAPGGYGGKDIWFAVQDGDHWSMPENAGPQINSTGDEMFPTMRQNGTLYFSSNGHPGYGGLDIFMAQRDTVSPDSTGVPHYEIINLGIPFNSNGDDFGITFEGKTDNGYFSSNRNDKKGYDQIYRFILPEMIFLVEGTVTDNTGVPLSDVRLRLVGDDGTNTKLQVRRDGTYRIKLKRDVHYVMLASSRGYLNMKETLETTGLNDSYTATRNFALSPISKPVKMDNVFYEFGKWNVTTESAQALDGLVKLLQDNPNITIELSAHTDLVGNAQANKTLSEKRAQSVVSYLIDKGIAADRLTPVGYGKEKPVVADKVINKQYPFIPCEQVLDEEFILSLPKEQQEICNQINRRTEFKVLKTTYGLY